MSVAFLSMVYIFLYYNTLGIINFVVVCQASKSSSLLDHGKAVSNHVGSRSSFPLVASDENLMRKRKFPGPAGILPKLVSLI